MRPRTPTREGGGGGGWGEGLLIRVSYWEVPPQGPTPHPLTYHFGRKKYPFYIPSISLGSRRLEVVGTRKNGRVRKRNSHPSRVSLARARSLFRPLLSSACYAG